MGENAFGMSPSVLILITLNRRDMVPRHTFMHPTDFLWLSHQPADGRE